MSESKQVAVMNTTQSNWTPAQIQLLKNTVCKDATDDEFKIFCYAVQRTGLDPFMKQIHMVKRWNKNENRYDMSIQVGIDGYRLIADRAGLYAGNDEPLFDNEKSPTKATVTVYKLVQGVRCAFTASARWTEYFPGEKQGFMWKKMPCVMLGKVAEALALRKAFPAELSGLYTEDEMAQADAKPVQSEVEETKSKAIGTNKFPEPTELELKMKAEFQKIAFLMSELKISKDDLRAEIFEEYKIDDPKKLSLDQIKGVVAILEKEQESRKQSKLASDNQSDKQAEKQPELAPWEQETTSGFIGG